jgi:large subunit ribosomal protein L35
MPKLKTHSGAAKRFKKTGTGKIKRGHSKMRHILTSKAPKTKRALGKSTLVSDGDHAKVARMIPYCRAAQHASEEVQPASSRATRENAKGEPPCHA